MIQIWYSMATFSSGIHIEFTILQNASFEIDGRRLRHWALHSSGDRVPSLRITGDQEVRSSKVPSHPNIPTPLHFCNFSRRALVKASEGKAPRSICLEVALHNSF